MTLFVKFRMVVLALVGGPAGSQLAVTLQLSLMELVHVHAAALTCTAANAKQTKMRGIGVRLLNNRAVVFMEFLRLFWVGFV